MRLCFQNRWRSLRLAHLVLALACSGLLYPIIGQQIEERIVEKIPDDQQKVIDDWKNRPAVFIVRMLMDGKDASSWSIYTNFTYEVVGERLRGGLAGGRPFILEGEVQCSMTLQPTSFLVGNLSEHPPLQNVTELSEVYRYPGLRLTKGGIYTACWCPATNEWFANLPCWTAEHGPLHVTGPIELLGGKTADEVPAQDPEDAASPYVLDRVVLAVTGYRLKLDHDRIRVVDAEVKCGSPGAAYSSQAFLPSGTGVIPASVKPGIQVLPSLGLPSTVGQVSAKDSLGYFPEIWAPLAAGEDPTGNGSSLVWSDLSFTTAGIYRVCWCSAKMDSDRGSYTIETDVFPPLYPEGNLTNETYNFTLNETNDTNEDDEFPAAGQRRLRSASTEGDNGSNVSGMAAMEDDINGTNESNVSAPYVHPCRTDAMFGLDLGNFSIAGPTGLEVLGAEGYDKRKVRVGTNFSLVVHGFGLGYNRQRLRLVLEPTRCGQLGTFNGTEHLLGSVADDPELPGAGADPLRAQQWGPMSLSRSGLYYVCMCSGRLGRKCDNDEDFHVHVGSVLAFWPNMRLRQAKGFELRVLPDVLFDLYVEGPEISQEHDRVRIVELETECGQPGSETNSFELRGPLGELRDSPGEYVPGKPGGHPSLVWPNLRLLTGGARRVCWCPGAGQAGALPKSCTKAEDFYAEVGTFAALQIRDGWSSACARAEDPILVHVAAIGLLPDVDRALLVKASEVCGEGRPLTLSPGGVLGGSPRLAGWAALSCKQDPNAGAEHLERKMVCGGDEEALGAVRTFAPGTYQICVCGALPLYDCSDPSHYWTPAGKPIKVGMRSTATAAGPSVPPPSLLTSSSVPTVAAFAAKPVGKHRRLAAAYEDGAIRVWEPGIPELKCELVGHVGRVEAIAWAPDSSWFASGGLDGTIRIWSANAGMGKDGTGVPPHICPAWEPIWNRPGGNMPDIDWQDAILGHLIVMNPHNISQEPFVPYSDRIPYNDLADIGRLTLKRAALQCEKACRNFREMASNFCECGSSLECHHLGNCVPKCGLEAHVWPRAHAQRVSALAVSSDGAVIASASFDTFVYIWDAKNFKLQPLATISIHDRPVLSLAFSPAAGTMGEILATGGDDDLIAWFSLGALLGAGPSANLAPIHTFREQVFRGVSTAASVSSCTYRCNDVAGLGRNLPVLAVAFSPDGRWFAAAGPGGVGKLWDAETKTEVRHLQPVLATASNAQNASLAGMTFTLDGNWLAIRGPATVKMLPLSNVKAGLPPPSGIWVSYTGEELGKTVLTWFPKPGPAGNTPRYGTKLHSNGTILELQFAPCNVTEGCDTNLPVVRAEFDVPFEFVAVRGYFLEYSLGDDDNLADDCRGGAQQTAWDELTPAKSYFAHVGRGKSAEGLDCERVGPMYDQGRESLEACKQRCQEHPLCNLINYRYSVLSCDLRYCLNASSPKLGENPDVDAHALIEFDDADELLDPTHDGYAMFGAPDPTGSGGVVYGGCQAGREIPRSGVWITIPETAVQRTRTLRFQVAQSRNTEYLAIGEIFLELLQPVEEEQTLIEPGDSSAIAVAPDRLEIVASTADYFGSLAVWDARGFEIPKGRSEQYKLKVLFGFEIRALGMEESDRMKIVDGNEVAVCGSPYSSVATRQVQGPSHGQRNYGNEGASVWTGYAAMQPGNYRACLCGGQGECCNVDGLFATELLSFVVAGVEADHYAICEVSLKNWPRREIKTCIVDNFRGVGTQPEDKIQLQVGQYCGMEGPIPGLPHLGVLTSRVPQPRDLVGQHQGGTWYRFETEYVPQNPGDDWGTYDAAPVMPSAGMIAKLCWCSKLSNCDGNRPEGFSIDAGIISLVRLEGDVEVSCYMRGPCAAVLQLDVSKPIAVGDMIVVKRGAKPWMRLVGCTGDVVTGIGTNLDGYSGRLTADGNTGTFELGTADSVDSGTYRLCWCQASIRPCVTPEEFNFDIGSIFVRPAAYVWPTCSQQESTFTSWRQWQTFDDCCCNYDEAGAIGCKDELSTTFKLCSEYPPR
eukprot:TRINITY_DN5474_c0_g2_i1.p1 TRINITY_DN5474_c0_g2~~TRINITY_DN5474_c0_g2_i1.p1  ORF type:complete len:2016 (-),score=255.03 TRINITY_DN5474_c0_g2_i1:107-6154(-)